MIINDSLKLNEVKSINLGNGSTAYKVGDKYYIKKGDTKKEISSDQYVKLQNKDKGSTSKKLDKSDNKLPSYDDRLKDASKNDVSSYLDKLDDSSKFKIHASTQFSAWDEDLSGERITGNKSDEFSLSDIKKYVGNSKVRNYTMYNDGERDRITFKKKRNDNDGYGSYTVNYTLIKVK